VLLDRQQKPAWIWFLRHQGYEWSLPVPIVVTYLVWRWTRSGFVGRDLARLVE
jgi:hypothetical protein